MPELVLELAHAESGTVGLDHERRDPARVPGRRVGHGEHDVEVGDPQVRDPVLGPVDRPLVAVERGLGQHSARIRAGIGLRERERRAPLARGAPGQEALLELVGPEQLDRECAELLDHQDQRRRGACLGDLLDGDVQHQRAGAGAAVLGLERQAEDVLLGQKLAQVVWILGHLVDLGRARGDLFPGDLADGVPEVEVLLRHRVELCEC